MAVRPSLELARHRASVLDLVRSAGVGDVRVFGSVARGQDQPGSDLDLLITPPDTMGLVELVALEQALEDLLGVRVDIVDARSRGRVIAQALTEAVPL
jgi:predicted nucleotidyltransferase